MIELIGVTKSYAGGKIALRETSATFGRGELVWLSGPSGSGKSTLVGIASLLLVRTSGIVRIDGETVPPRDEVVRTTLRRELFGIVPQSPRLFPELSPVQNVLLSSSRLTVEDARASLSLVGLGHSGRQAVKTMSGGEQQRVSVARAIAKQPEFVFADESTSALDDENAHAVWQILRGIVDRGRAVVVASHDSRIAAYADRCIEVGRR
jgi:ABC-type lipoprotein export system ATPase subunit